MDHKRDDLRAAAQLRSIADATRESQNTLWSRLPFIWTVVIFLLFAAATGGIWTAKISNRLDKIEELSSDYKTDRIPETVHNNRDYIDELRKEGAIEKLHKVDRNGAQIRVINKTLYGVPDPGIDE